MKEQLKKIPVRIALIACLVVVGSVSCFLLWNHYSPQQDVLAVPLHSGWKQIAVYRGTGSQTILGQSISLPNFWGDILTCQGEGKLAIDARGERTHLNFGNDACATSPRPHESPQFLEFDIQTLHIRDVKVVASANVTWRLQFVQEVRASSLPMSPTAWVGQIGGSSTSGDTSISAYGNDVPVKTPDGQTIVPKIWGLLIVCLGTGTGSVQFTPNRGTMTFPPCDGVPRLRIVKYPMPTSVQEIQIKPTGYITSYVGLLACIDEQKCTDSSAP